MNIEPNNLLRIERIVLRNFRCFGEIGVDLNEKLTVFVAENATGKTALLDGLRIALNVVVSAIGRSNHVPGFDWSDVRLALTEEKQRVPQLPTSFIVTSILSGQRLAWSRTRFRYSGRARTSRKALQIVQRAIENLAAQAAVPAANTAATVVLPLVAYYGTGRLWNEHKLTSTKRWLAANTPARMSAYLDCLSPSSSFKAFSEWYHQMARSLRNPTLAPRGHDQRPELLLSAVRKAVRVVLEPTGWTEIDWEFPPRADGATLGYGYLVVEHPDKGRFPLSLLSDGVRSMVALVGDLAHRCARLNSHFGESAARDTPGILMIDEVDLHLHPRWQQKVVGLLQEAFPRLQLIITTHSPQVLTTLRKENIRIVAVGDTGSWTAQPPARSPLAQEPSDALAFIMGADPRPRLPLLEDIHRYEQLARSGNAESDEARATLRRLVDAGFEFSEADLALFAFIARKQHPTNGGGNG